MIDLDPFCGTCGADLVGANLYRYRGRMICKRCNARRTAEWRKRKAAKKK